jgi:hypothetical protein
MGISAELNIPGACALLLSPYLLTRLIQSKRDYQLVLSLAFEALPYKSESRGVHSQFGCWDFSLIIFSAALCP